MLDIAFDVAIISLWVNLEDICLAVVISDLYLIFFFSILYSITVTLGAPSTVSKPFKIVRFTNTCNYGDKISDDYCQGNQKKKKEKEK
jgi:hypothetical protein